MTTSLLRLIVSATASPLLAANVPAQILSIASALFCSISGVVESNIVPTGVVTIRMMKKGGFKPHTAAAIETVASTRGNSCHSLLAGITLLSAAYFIKENASRTFPNFSQP